MGSFKKYLLESLFRLAVLWLKVVQSALYRIGLRRDIALPPREGAAGRDFRVSRVNGMPVLWSGGLPYPTHLDQSSHPVQLLHGTWKMRFDGNETGGTEGWQDTTNFGPEWMIGFNFTPVVDNFVDRWIRGN